MPSVNIWAVLVSAVASMVIGSIWFGPLFGKMYIHEMGMDQWTPEKQAEMKKKMTAMYVVQFVASIATFYVLAVLMSKFGALSVSGGLKTASLVWIGFYVPYKLGDALWGGNMKLFWLGIGNMLLTILAGAAILGAWH